MIRIIFCGYRQWAFDIFDYFKEQGGIEILHILKSNDEALGVLRKMDKFDVDAVIYCGWSWKVPSDILEKFLCVGIHPSDLPFYRGGSPLQYQIMDGLTETKCTLMTLSDNKLDAGDIWGKESLSLAGDRMEDIFCNLTKSSIVLLERFFADFGKISPIPQNLSEGSIFRRRKPEDSHITENMLRNMSLRQLYDFIRALTDPYPNAYMEDEEGNRLVFKEVKYVEKEDLRD